MRVLVQIDEIQFNQSRLD